MYSGQILVTDILPLGSHTDPLQLRTILQERWIESRHAKNKSHLAGAHNAGPCHMAFMSLLPMLKRMLQDAKLETLSQKCMQVRTPLAQIAAMKFGNHPEVLRVKREYGTLLDEHREVNRKGAKELHRILFHCDRATLHKGIPALEHSDMCFPPPPPPPTHANGGDDEDDDDMPPPPLPPPPSPPSGPGHGRDDNQGDRGRPEPDELDDILGKPTAKPFTSIDGHEQHGSISHVMCHSYLT